MKSYVDALASFTQTTYGNVHWLVEEGTSRTLQIAIPSGGMSNAQSKVFDEIIEYAKEKGVEIITIMID